MATILSRAALSHRHSVLQAGQTLADMEREYIRRCEPRATDRYLKTEQRKAQETISAWRRSMFCHSLVYAFRTIWPGREVGQHDFRYVPEFYWELDYIRCRKNRPRRHLVQVGRGYGKTELLLVAETIQDLMADPNECIGQGSADLKLSVKTVGLVKYILENHTGLHEMFPDRFWDNPSAEAKTWREDSILLPRKAMLKEASLTALSLDRNDTGAHYHRIKMDDPITIENANTKDQREKVKEQLAMIWKLFVAPVEIRDALVVGTPYHYDDAYQAMLDNPEWTKTIIPCAVYPSTDGLGGFEPWDGVDEPDREPESIFPEIYPMPVLRKQRDSTDPREVAVFYSQMLLKPTAGEDAIFTPSMFETPWDATEEAEARVRRRPLYFFTAVDAAATTGPRSDFTAITTVGFDSERNGYVFRISKGRWQQDGIVAEAISHAKEFGSKFILWEAVAFAERDCRAYEIAALAQGVPTPVIPVKRGKMSKEERIEGGLVHQGFRHFLQTGKCHFRVQHRQHIQEILRYPKGHNDVLDTLTDIFERAYPGPKTEAEAVFGTGTAYDTRQYQIMTHHGLS